MKESGSRSRQAGWVWREQRTRSARCGWTPAESEDRTPTHDKGVPPKEDARIADQWWPCLEASISDFVTGAIRSSKNQFESTARTRSVTGMRPFAFGRSMSGL